MRKSLEEYRNKFEEGSEKIKSPSEAVTLFNDVCLLLSPVFFEKLWKDNSLVLNETEARVLGTLKKKVMNLTVHCQYGHNHMRKYEGWCRDLKDDLDSLNPRKSSGELWNIPKGVNRLRREY